MKTDVIINREALYALRELPSESVNCCVTSPPYYGLRDYGLDAQIGREDTPEQYIDRLVEVFRELRRVLKDDGTFWLNIADTYCGSGMKTGCKQKDLIGIPWLLAFALRSDGWYLRSDIIWLKENPMPESCRDRPSRCYEHIFLLTKTSVYKGYKRDKIEMRGDRAEISDFPLYLNTVAGGLDCRDQTIGGFSFVVKIYAVPVVEIIG